MYSVLYIRISKKPWNFYFSYFEVLKRLLKRLIRQSMKPNIFCYNASSCGINGDPKKNIFYGITTNHDNQNSSSVKFTFILRYR